MAATAQALSLSVGYDFEVGRLKKELETSADPRIEKFLRGCWDLILEVRNVPPKEVYADDELQKRRMYYDNSHAVSAMEAIGVATARVRDLKFEALPPHAVTERLQQIASELDAALRVDDDLSRFIAPKIESHELMLAFDDSARQT